MENLKKLGFGCMRLPMLDVENNKVDMEQFCKMVDTFSDESLSILILLTCTIIIKVSYL